MAMMQPSACAIGPTDATPVRRKVCLFWGWRAVWRLDDDRHHIHPRSGGRSILGRKTICVNARPQFEVADQAQVDFRMPLPRASVSDGSSPNSLRYSLAKWLKF